VGSGALTSGFVLSDWLRLPVKDTAGQPLGRISDIAVEAGDQFPRVVALSVRQGRDETLVPWDRVERGGRRRWWCAPSSGRRQGG